MSIEQKNKINLLLLSATPKGLLFSANFWTFDKKMPYRRVRD